MSKKVDRHVLTNRMSEYLDNFQAEKAGRAPVVGNGRSKYDFAAGRKLRAEQAAHHKNFSLSNKARDNFDRIFRK